MADANLGTPRAALTERYRTGTADLLDALRDITDDELDRPQADGEWTPRQVVHHLADGETMSATRLRRLIADPDPLIQGYDEPRFAQRLHYDRPIESSLAVIDAVRAASLDLMAAMTEADWAKAGTHSDSGVYSVMTWLEIYSEHVHEHADQIRRGRYAPVEPGSMFGSVRLIAEDDDAYYGVDAHPSDAVRDLT